MGSDTRTKEILEQIRATVQEKRQRGEYAGGLELQLEEEFAELRTIVHGADASKSEVIRQQLLNVLEAMNHVTGRTPTESQIPGASLIHKIVAKLTARQTSGLAGQLQEVHRALESLLTSLTAQATARNDADERMVNLLAKNVVDRIAVVDHLVLMVAEMESRLRHLETS